MKRAALAAAALNACLALSACKAAPATHSEPAGTASAPSPAPSASASAAPAASARSALPPLIGVAWIEHLDLEDGHEAYVTPPIGAREPRPLIVAVHGAGDRAEWSCGGWRMVASEYAFVVCPQGLKMDALRFGWDSAETIRKRVRLAIAAARARFGEYIAPGPTVFVGFSQGATLSAPTLLDPAQPFGVIALSEGGYNVIQNQATLKRLAEQGVQRLLLACGTPGCFTTMKASVPAFERAGLGVLIGGDPRAGHNLNGEMQAGLQRVWPQFVADLPNWRGFRTR